MLKPATIAIIVYRCLVTFSFLILSLPVSAQVYEPVGQPSSGIPPLFIIPDFEGDARVQDLYWYLHAQPEQPWNSYQLLVKQIAEEDAININIPPSLATSGTPIYSNSVGGASTSVSGMVLPSTYNSAPGLAR